MSKLYMVTDQQPQKSPRSAISSPRRMHAALSLVNRTFCFTIAVLSMFLVSASVAFAQENASGVLAAQTSASPDEILAMFVKTETRVREALNQHTFKREVVLQTIGHDGQVTGEYIRNSQFLFDDKGNRIERVTYHPPSTIREMKITTQDIQDLAGAQLLGIDIAETAKYNLTYAGQEALDFRKVYVIDVTPRINPNPHRMSERFFRGRIWIDPATFQIIKLKGKAEPQGKQRFPVFETWRTAVTPDLQLPTRTEADDVLHFPNRDVNYRIRVRYYDYKLFASRLKVIEIDEPGN